MRQIIEINSTREETNYTSLMARSSILYNRVQFVNLSMGALGIYGKTCEDLVIMLKDLNMIKKEIDFVLCKLCIICFQCTYYIICSRNRE